MDPVTQAAINAAAGAAANPAAIQYAQQGQAAPQPPQFAPQPQQFATPFPQQAAPQYQPAPMPQFTPQFQQAPPAPMPQFAPQFQQAAPQFAPPFQSPAAPQFQQAPPAAPAPAAPQFAPPAAHPGVTLSPQEYAAFLNIKTSQEQATLAQQQAQAQQAQTQIKTVASTEGIDKALQLQNERWQAIVNQQAQQTQQIESQWLSEKKASTLQGVLAATGIQWASPEAAADAYAKVAAQFDAVKGPLGDVTIRQKGTMLPVAEAMQAILQGPSLKHYMAPSTQGGVGTGQAAAFSPGNAQNPMVPHGFQVAQTPGEQAYAEWMAGVSAQRQAGYAATGLSFSGNYDPFALAQQGPGQPFARQPQVQQTQANAFNPLSFMAAVGGPGGYRPGNN